MQEQKTENLAQQVAQIKTMDFKKNLPLILGAFGIVVAGVLIGWLITSRGGLISSTPVSSGIKVSDTEAGIIDSNFKGDTATGKLVEGGINGEGAFHLERDGGPSKNVYLTSSVVDLSSFVGKDVEIWGETLAAKKAGWLMDVVKIKVVQ